MVECKVDGCGKPAKNAGLCWGHYTRQRRYGDPTISRRASPNRTPPATCTIEGCERKHFSKGFCTAHYHRQWRHGDPVAPMMRAPSGAHIAWLESMVEHEGDECRTWPFKARNPQGYGVTEHNGRMHNASHVMCLLAHGNPPTAGHEAAHSCGKGHEGCVNPRHLRWATRSENHADKWLHGTAICGERSPAAKLTEGQVLAIRAADAPISVIAADFCISVSHVYDLRAGKRWSHLKQVAETV